MEHQVTPIIDREVFFGNPEIIEGRLSPDGKYLAFIKPYQSVRNIWIKSINAPFEEARPITSDTNRPIPAYFWSYDSKYILYVQDKGGNEDFHVYAVNPFSEEGIPAAANLTDIEGVKAIIYSVPKSEPDYIYVGLNDRDPAWHDLYKIHISTGLKEKYFENIHQINDWIFDLNDRLRLVTKSSEEGGLELLKVIDGGLVKCYESSVEENFEVLRYHQDGKRFFMETNVGETTDLSKLILFNPDTGEEEFIEEDPEEQVDFGKALFSDLSNELVATIYRGDKMRFYFRDSSTEEDYHFLKQRFPEEELNISSLTKDEQKWLIHVNSDVDPGTAYLFDRTTKELSFQYRPRPNLPSEHLANMQPVRYNSFDGLEIPAYLTVPKVAHEQLLPAILLIHGGPWARDYWGFDSFAQFLANRGYIVLQPNFRGSTGYGKAFLNAGNGEWGAKMQDDISAGVRFLVRNGLADPQRIGIVGGSYGGYATLAGLTFTPELYATGVSIVGPSNLRTLLASIPPYWETIRNMFYKRIANPETEQGIAWLRERSPLFHAKEIRAPLMVVQGANDPRVKKAESDQVVIALRELGLPVEYLLAKDEGHGFSDPTNNLAFVAAMEQFLAQHLGGRFQKAIPDSISARLNDLRVDISHLELPPDLENTKLSISFPEALESLLPISCQYRMTIIGGQSNAPIDFERTVNLQDGHWVIMDRAQSLMGKIEDTALLDKNTLRPLRQTIVQGPAKVDIEYANSNIKGVLSINNKTKPFQIECDGPCVGSGVARTILIQQLPLAEGYVTKYRFFDPQFQQIKHYELKVVGIETIDLGWGEPYETFRVENHSIDGEGDYNIFWITTAVPRLLVKSESVTSSMGATFIFELSEIPLL